MLIRDMFVKSIERDIKGVIKVGQADDENIKQELEEYVVTRELQKHFAEFFSSYNKGINGYTDKMGVWISGFFGSGKSHLLKILSYLLENKEVDGKKAIDYFIEDEKISDPMVIADMERAASVPTDVILFNIDSKSEMTGKHSKDAIVSVFLKVFNEMQGFCGSIPFLADLERQLTEQNQYDLFKAKFEELRGESWIDSRHKFDFIQDDVVAALVAIDFMSETAAWNWCEKSFEPYQVSIENFARLVNEYLSKKEPDHHIVFLVDEIGQYIGDNSKLMLNLQTVTEDLGTACHGKVWIVVTSQQDIDVVTKTKGNDFSKIQGRFDTRLSLSSANVDEVIKKRILEKTDSGEQTLRLLYERKETTIKNLIVFHDSVEKKLYTDEHDFAMVYPFVPYQFNLLASVLTSIRTHGASGKHLSEGERSMIALFKESAMKLMHLRHGALIPFNIFYDALHQFLDHSHKGVISKAADNDYVNPDKEDDCFNVNVLKTLFMIKYVKEITPNIENITSLMISDIDIDRIALKKRVEEALKILTQQMLVQKNGEFYVFLTDEEQEINREIENQNVDMGEIINKASIIIFEEIFTDKKYKYPDHNGRYNFGFNLYVDDRPYRANQRNDIGLRILTPGSDYADDEISLRMKSGQNKEVLVVLPNDGAFLDELTRALKIEKYLRIATSNALAKFDQIKEAKRAEMRERNGNAQLFLEEAMKDAAIYVNGNVVETGNRDTSIRIKEALGNLVSTVYHKLYYIDTAMTEAHIRAIFASSKQQQFTLEDAEEVNAHALQDVLSFIASNSSMHIKSSMKSIMDRFTKAPYGFVEDDVAWLVAKLFKNSDISLSISGEPITLLNREKDQIIRYLTKREYVERLMLEIRKGIPPVHLKAAQEVMRDLFGEFSIKDDPDSLMQSFKNYCTKLENDLEKIEINFENYNYPGKKTVEIGKKLVRSVLRIDAPAQFFEQIYLEVDGFLDFAEAYEAVESFFFRGEQKKVFEEALRLMQIYYDSKTFIVNKELEKCVDDISLILQKERPYSDIPKLPALLEQFRQVYAQVLEKMSEPVYLAIEDAKTRVFEELNEKPYVEELKEDYLKRFMVLREKANTLNNVATLKNVKLEADALKMRLLDEMAKEDEKFISSPSDDGEVAVKPPPRRKRVNISIKSVSPSSSWQIKSPQDVDAYLDDLRKSILNQYEEGTILNIEL